MWRTHIGERILAGVEWEVVRKGIDCLWDAVEDQLHEDDPDEYLTGIAVFDQLQPNQKLAMLLHVGRALRRKGEPAPDLTAVSEGRWRPSSSTFG